MPADPAGAAVEGRDLAPIDDPDTRSLPENAVGSITSDDDRTVIVDGCAIIRASRRVDIGIMVALRPLSTQSGHCRANRDMLAVRFGQFCRTTE